MIYPISLDFEWTAPETEFALVFETSEDAPTDEITRVAGNLFAESGGCEGFFSDTDLSGLATYNVNENFITPAFNHPAANLQRIRGTRHLKLTVRAEGTLDTNYPPGQMGSWSSGEFYDELYDNSNIFDSVDIQVTEA